MGITEWSCAGASRGLERGDVVEVVGLGRRALPATLRRELGGTCLRGGIPRRDCIVERERLEDLCGGRVDLRGLFGLIVVVVYARGGGSGTRVAGGSRRS